MLRVDERVLLAGLSAALVLLLPARSLAAAPPCGEDLDDVLRQLNEAGEDDTRRCFAVPAAVADDCDTWTFRFDGAAPAREGLVEGHLECNAEAAWVPVSRRQVQSSLRGTSGALVLSKANKEQERVAYGKLEDPAEGGGDAEDADDGDRADEEKLPVDIAPKPIPHDDVADLVPQSEEDDEHVRVLYVNENLAILPESPDRYVTDADVIVVRFFVRKALACRMNGVANSSNEVGNDVLALGGQDGLTDLLAFRPSSRTTETGPTDEQEEQPRSCGYLLDGPYGEPGMYEPAEPVSEEGSGDGDDPRDGGDWTSVALRLGPFSNDEVKITLYRADRTFTGHDMKRELRLANHRRYDGWFEVMVLGSFYPHPGQDLSVRREPGTELHRVSAEDDTMAIDVGVGVKWLAWCSGEGNGWGGKQDLRAASVCVGLGSALSARKPAERFYPLGLNITAGRFVGLNVMLTVERTHRLAGGLDSGDLFDEGEPSIPRKRHVARGVAVGVGLDPSAFAHLVKAIFTGD
ncbi:MAG: hypothetical protein ACQEXJ_09320 [Myxococcota bacterium]